MPAMKKGPVFSGVRVAFRVHDSLMTSFVLRCFECCMYGFVCITSP